jgi:hypothetical protein
VLSLAYVLCEQLSPPGVLHRLKLGLLLSLAAGEANRLHLIARGSHTSLIKRWVKVLYDVKLLKEPQPLRITDKALPPLKMVKRYGYRTNIENH